MLKHLACWTVVLAMLHLCCGTRQAPVLDGAADTTSHQPDTSSGRDSRIDQQLPRDSAVNLNLFAALFVDKFFADCMPAVPPDPIALTGHMELLNNGKIAVGPIQLSGGTIVSATGATLATFDVKPIAPFVIKPGEGLSPEVVKVAGTLKPAGGCGLCGKPVQVEISYTGAGLPVGAKVVSAEVALSCAY